MLGFLIGAVAGAAEFFLLSAFVCSITEKQKPNVLFGLLFAFVPLAALLPVAFLLTDQLLWAGTGMAALLVLLAVVKFLIHTIYKGNDKK